MKIIIINGSARKGNTLTAINALIKGASEKNEIEVIEPDKLQIAPCKGCGACQCHKGCVDNDDTNPTIDKIAAADMILFTTPVYWWGMSAQLKLVIDKCYCRGLQLKNKKVGSAGLDVYEEESEYFYEDKSDRIIDDDVLARLLSFNNVIVTSHQAFFTKEAVGNIAMTTLENVRDFINHKPLLNEVKK